jgi:hypothetical protein
MKLTEITFKADRLAVGLEEFFREQVAWWDGEQC